MSGSFKKFTVFYYILINFMSKLSKLGLLIFQYYFRKLQSQNYLRTLYSKNDHLNTWNLLYKTQMFFISKQFNHLSNSLLAEVLWPGGSAMLSPRRWFSVPFSPPHNQSQFQNGSDLIHNVLGQVLQESLEFGFEHSEFELTVVYPRENTRRPCQAGSSEKQSPRKNLKYKRHQ